MSTTSFNHYIEGETTWDHIDPTDKNYLPLSLSLHSPSPPQSTSQSSLQSPPSIKVETPLMTLLVQVPALFPLMLLLRTHL